MTVGAGPDLVLDGANILLTTVCTAFAPILPPVATCDAESLIGPFGPGTAIAVPTADLLPNAPKFVVTPVPTAPPTELSVSMTAPAVSMSSLMLARKYSTP